MVSLLSYIFIKSHWLCVNVFKEKEFPEYYASGIIGILIAGTVTFLLNTILYLIDPNLINEIFGYYKYFSLGTLLLFWGYFGHFRKYTVFVDHFKNMSESKKKIVSVLSVVYIIVIVVGFFGIGDVMRNYNLANQ